MPAKSKAQQQAMAIAEHEPSKLLARNKGLLKMSHEQLHDFAATKRTGLPKRADKRGFQSESHSYNFKNHLGRPKKRNG
jgi:hypothetical protein